MSLPGLYCTAKMVYYVNFSIKLPIIFSVYWQLHFLNVFFEANVVLLRIVRVRDELFIYQQDYFSLNTRIFYTFHLTLFPFSGASKN
jgi:hypothetical protein